MTGMTVDVRQSFEAQASEYFDVLSLSKLAAPRLRKPLLYLSELRGHRESISSIWTLTYRQSLSHFHASALNSLKFHSIGRGKDGDSTRINSSQNIIGKAADESSIIARRNTEHNKLSKSSGPKIGTERGDSNEIFQTLYERTRVHANAWPDERFWS